MALDQRSLVIVYDGPAESVYSFLKLQMDTLQDEDGGNGRSRRGSTRRPGAVSVVSVLRFLLDLLQEAMSFEEGLEEVSQVAALLFGQALDERQEGLEPC